MTTTNLSPVETVRLFQGDCRKVMAALPDNSVDSVVCDPPYEIAFLNRRWDNSGVAFDPEIWRHALRVLKPGGHLLAFGATRTYHRMAVAIEDSGFEVRDCIMWIHSMGFPKSVDMGKAFATRKPNRRIEEISTDLLPDEKRFVDWMRDESGLDEQTLRKLTTDGDRFVTGKVRIVNTRRRDLPPGWARLAMVPTSKTWDRIKDKMNVAPPGWVEDLVKRPPREQVLDDFLVAVKGETPDGCTNGRADGRPWSGWGTALKPACEPVILARKPMSEPNTAHNLSEHGTGAINIDACRTDSGRWPANVILDEDAAQMLDEQSGASRFFYCAKAPQRERPQYTNASGKTVKHSTVKPLSLMRYLVRLVTPPNGTVLDPFAGSGATLEAAMLEGFNSIGIELGEDHIPLILQRLEREQAA